ncbi:carbohydrate sulfotransferase 8 [Crotalus adamanteus]|uniref:Carbohydrate sulfotransferase n=1 Tax=Crotalus adamanteus TaxID=8729 RepID=A0AAW1AUL2_CROAD
MPAEGRFHLGLIGKCAPRSTSDCPPKAAQPGRPESLKSIRVKEVPPECLQLLRLKLSILPPNPSLKQAQAKPLEQHEEVRGMRYGRGSQEAKREGASSNDQANGEDSFPMANQRASLHPVRDESVKPRSSGQAQKALGGIQDRQRKGPGANSAYQRKRKFVLRRSPLRIAINGSFHSLPLLKAEAKEELKWRSRYEVQRERKRIMRDTCSKYKSNNKRVITPYHVSRIFVEDKYRILYCEVPKAGCSNWKRVLMVLNGLASSTRVIQHNTVHYGNYLKKLDGFDHKGINYRLSTYTKMLFVREPFEKLVSAFRDKFEHPNNYYHPVFGRPIISKYRPNATKEALRTGSGVEFKEFVQYLLDVHRPVGMDIHWDHINRLMRELKIITNEDQLVPAVIVSEGCISQRKKRAPACQGNTDFPGPSHCGGREGGRGCPRAAKSSKGRKADSSRAARGPQKEGEDGASPNNLPGTEEQLAGQETGGESEPRSLSQRSGRGRADGPAPQPGRGGRKTLEAALASRAAAEPGARGQAGQAEAGRAGPPGSRIRRTRLGNGASAPRRPALPSNRGARPRTSAEPSRARARGARGGGGRRGGPGARGEGEPAERASERRAKLAPLHQQVPLPRRPPRLAGRGAGRARLSCTGAGRRCRLQLREDPARRARGRWLESAQPPSRPPVAGGTWPP